VYKLWSRHQEQRKTLTALGLKNDSNFQKFTGFPEITLGRILKLEGNKQEIQCLQARISGKPGKVTGILQPSTVLTQRQTMKRRRQVNGDPPLLPCGLSLTLFFLLALPLPHLSPSSLPLISLPHLSPSSPSQKEKKRILNNTPSEAAFSGKFQI
jgi:hypothetical protein